MTSSARAGYVDVGEAARLLGVSKRHVARLGEHGDIFFVGRGVVELASLNAYLSERQFSRERAWGTDTAWAAVALLSGLQVDWLGQTQLSRLRRRLQDLAEADSGPHELIGRARERAEVRTYESFDFLIPPIKKHLVVASSRRLGIAPARRDQLDGYLTPDAAEELEKRYGLRRDARGTLILRVTAFDLDVVKHLATKGNGALAALDLAASQDARAHGVGLRALDSYLDEFAATRRATG